MDICHVLGNEEGSAIIIAVVLLLVVTVMGIAAINTSTTEIKIYHNEIIYQRNFYQAESAAIEAAKRIEVEKDTNQLRPDSTTYNWVKDKDEVKTKDMTDTANWVYEGSEKDNSYPSLFNTDPKYAINVKYAIVGRGIAKGSSLDVGASTVHVFSVYGLSESNNGNVLIEIGYRRRF